MKEREKEGEIERKRERKREEEEEKILWKLPTLLWIGSFTARGNTELTRLCVAYAESGNTKRRKY
jgi:hypothetical protein